jgi:hypothetical protein
MFSPVKIQQSLGWLPLLLLTGLVFNALSVLAQSDGNVTIRVVDGSGQSITCGMGKFTSLDGKIDLTSRFDDLRGIHIPYGTYKYSLWRKPPSMPGEVIERNIEVKLPETLSVVVAPLFTFPNGIVAERTTPRGFVMNGKLEPLPTSTTADTPGPNQQPIWIRLSPLFGNGPSLDVDVDTSGEFRIYTMLGGHYLLAVIRGTETLHIEEVAFDQGGNKPQQIIIKLPQRQPTVVHVR